MQLISLANSIALYTNVLEQVGNERTLPNLVSMKNPSFTTAVGEKFYALSEQDNGYVASFGPTGKKISSAQVKGSPAHIAVNKEKSLLAVASYGGGVVTVLKTNAAGMIGEKVMEKTYNLTAPGAVPDRQEGSHPHQVVFDDTKMYVPDLGMDLIHVFDTPTMKEGYPIVAKPGCGPRHMVVLDKINMLVVCELSSTIAIVSSGKILGYVPIDTTNGRAAPLHVSGGAEIANIGNHIYVSQRNPDEKRPGNGFIAHFKFDPTTTELIPMKNYKLDGKMPRQFAIDDNKLYVMLQDKDFMEVFKMKPDGGLFSPPTIVNVGEGGACISFTTPLPTVLSDKPAGIGSLPAIDTPMNDLEIPSPDVPKANALDQVPEEQKPGFADCTEASCGSHSGDDSKAATSGNGVVDQVPEEQKPGFADCTEATCGSHSGDVSKATTSGDDVKDQLDRLGFKDC